MEAAAARRTRQLQGAISGMPPVSVSLGCGVPDEVQRAINRLVESEEFVFAQQQRTDSGCEQPSVITTVFKPNGVKSAGNFSNPSSSTLLQDESRKELLAAFGID